MKILVEQAKLDNNKVIMQTSVRGGFYTIKFYDKGNRSPYAYNNWGHLNVRQAKKMVEELNLFIGQSNDLETIEGEAFGVGYDAGYNAGIENKNSTEKGINHNG
tara:strand:+ start:3140 stop:3451 length:312 start_codon:yes stop_codon:yes gene_type:complete